MKHKAKSPKAPALSYIFQVESLSHEGRGIAHYGSRRRASDLKNRVKNVFIRYAFTLVKLYAQ